MMRRLVTIGAALAMAALSNGCVPVDPAPTSTTSAPPTTTAACEIERRTIETAIEAYAAEHASGGVPSYPESFADLSEHLKDLPSPEWAYTGEGSTYTLTGPC